MVTKREIIARNIADLLNDGDVVNLGVGIPSLVGNYICTAKMAVWEWGRN